MPLAPKTTNRRARVPARAGVLAMLVVASMAASGCGVLDSPAGEAGPAEAEVTEEIVGCDAATNEAGPVPSIDLGSIVVAALADAERVPVDGGTEIRFAVEVEPFDPDAVPDVDDDGRLHPSSLAILQARTAEETAVLLRADAVAEAGADRPGPASALSFERCALPVRHQVTLLVTRPGCLVLVANDPATGGFTELPVRVGVAECSATPPPAPVG